MEKIKYLKDLFMYEMQNLHTAEEQVTKALPAMIKKAKHRSLKNALKNYQSITEEHKNRLKEIQKMSIGANKDIDAKKGKAIKGLIDEATMLLENDFNAEIANAAIIASIQKIVRYKVCTYNIAQTYAGKMNAGKEGKILRKLLNEERDTDDLLNQLAQIILPQQIVAQETEASLKSDKKKAKIKTDDADNFNEENNDSTVNIQSPGGRAGTSHRGYATGESRGH